MMSSATYSPCRSMCDRYRSVGVAATVFVVILLVGGPALAQTPAAQPSLPPVFAGTLPRSGGPTSGVLVTVSEAYDENVLAEGATPLQNSLEAGGFYTDLNATFAGHIQRQKLQFSTAAG